MCATLTHWHQAIAHLVHVFQSQRLGIIPTQIVQASQNTMRLLFSIVKLSLLLQLANALPFKARDSDWKRDDSNRLLEEAAAGNADGLEQQPQVTNKADIEDDGDV